jgi:hypothetical protein
VYKTDCKPLNENEDPAGVICNATTSDDTQKGAAFKATIFYPF